MEKSVCLDETLTVHIRFVTEYLHTGIGSVFIDCIMGSFRL